jgi:hypothetical protein
MLILRVEQGRTDRQIFAVTSGRVLPVGMCGGPVVVNRQWDEVQFRPAVVGMSHETLAQPWDASAGPKGGLHTAKENSNTNSSTTGTASPSARGKRSPVPLNISRDANILRVQALRAKHSNSGAMTAEESYEDENKLVYGEYQRCVDIVLARVCGLRAFFWCGVGAWVVAVAGMEYACIHVLLRYLVMGGKLRATAFSSHAAVVVSNV